ncbi:MAG: HAD family hydrolase [Phycisphaerae bacterium]
MTPTATDLPYDLLAVDLDGTLLDRTSRVSPRNRSALHALHEAGAKIVLCTGRCFTETLPVVREIGLDLDAAVTAGGAVLTDLRTLRTIERVNLPLPRAREVAAWIERREFAYLWLYDADEAGFDGYAVDGSRRHAAFDRWLSKTPCAMRPAVGVPNGSIAPVRLSLCDDAALLEPVSRELDAAFRGLLRMNVLRAPTYDVTLLEIFSAPVDKWLGIQKLCRLWKIDEARTVAMGDDVNDVEMIRRAGLGVAMANAHPPARQAAQRIAPPFDQDGVAEIIDDVFLRARNRERERARAKFE